MDSSNFVREKSKHSRAATSFRTSARGVSVPQVRRSRAEVLPDERTAATKSIASYDNKMRRFLSIFSK